MGYALLKEKGLLRPKVGHPRLSARQRAARRWNRREKDILTLGCTSGPTLPGQYYDQETKLHYNYHRYYDPAIGRYITSDPIGLAGGLNTYGYALQNPVSYYDQDGLNPAWGLIWTVKRVWNGCRWIYKRVREQARRDNKDKDPRKDDRSRSAQPPNIDDFSDSENLPDGWEWRGSGKLGSREGAYHNPLTGESLHDDRTHPLGKDPHVTYTDPEGVRWDNFGDGWIRQ